MNKYTADDVQSMSKVMEIRDYCAVSEMLDDLAHRLRKEEEENKRDPIGEKHVLQQIARIAHAGGSQGLVIYDALDLIRKLSLPYWDKERAPNIRRSEVPQ